MLLVGEELLLTFHRDLSARLGLSEDEGEKWIVNLIRDTRMDGKLDYKEGTVLMNHPANSVYQQVRITHTVVRESSSSPCL